MNLYVKLFQFDATTNTRLQLSYAPEPYVYFSNAETKPELEQLLDAKNLCFSAIEQLDEMINKEYPIKREDKKDE